MVKKWICVCLALIMALGLTGCYRVMDEYEPEKTEYRIAASCYPIYALSLMAVQDVPGIVLTCLVQPQVGCLRSYQLSEWDALQAAEYDALILGGRGLESYESALLQWENGPILLCAMEGLTLRNNGRQAKGEEDSHYDGENPWLFLSPEGALQMVRSIAANMAMIDPEYAHMYQANLEAAEAELTALAAEMKQMMEGVELGNVALMHEGLCYFAEFMGVEWVYVYERESGEDVTDNMLTDMLAEMESAGVDTVLMENVAPETLVRALEENGYDVCLIDTLSAHSADGDPRGYVGAMRKNGEILAKMEE